MTSNGFLRQVPEFLEWNDDLDPKGHLCALICDNQQHALLTASFPVHATAADQST